MTKHLLVLFRDDLVGRLWLDRRHDFCFQYDREWLESAGFPLSLSLPLRSEPFDQDWPHAFFANLLPDGELREAVARRLQVSEGNDFGILERIGGDCAGAISVVSELSPPDADPCYEALDEVELARLIRELPMRPLLAGERGIRISLAGAQKKLAVFFDGDVFGICRDGAPSTFIIKPPRNDLDHTVENEAFCMQLARRLGLPVPDSFIGAADGSSFFAVRRYDRYIEDGRVHLLHQEDFCQALNRLPKHKYEVDGGPSFRECFELVKSVSRRAPRDSVLLIRWLVFNFLVGNTDNHAKNISLLHLLDGPVLAPFYDLISTRIYSHYGVATSLAMTIGGESDPERIQKRHWEALAADTGVKPQLVFDIIKQMCSVIKEITIGMRKGEFKPYDCDALLRLVMGTNERAETTYKRLF